MSYLGLLTMSIQNASRQYLTASQNMDTSWTITPVTGQAFIKVLPDGWAETTIEWARDTSYLGVFRSKGGADYKFSQDARAIIQNIRNTQGIQGYGLFTIWIWNEATFGYDVFYQSELDFKSIVDDMQNELLSINILDSGLIRDLKAYGDTKYNVPVWNQLSGSEYELNDAEVILHKGIKLLYNATWISSATTDNPLEFSLFTSPASQIDGFNGGQHGTGTNSGQHTVLNLASFNITQNNGTTTFIGNDILQNQLLQGNQTVGANGQIEEKFSGTNNSQPYTRKNYSFFNYLANVGNSIDMYVNVVATFGDVDIFSTGTPVAPFLGFVLFEIDKFDQPTVDGSGNFTYHTIYKFPLTGATTPGASINVTVPLSLANNKAYVFCLVYDDVPSLGPGNLIQKVKFSELQFSILSKYDSGASGIPIPAPSLNPTMFAGFRLGKLLSKIVPNFATRRANDYGFPIAVATPYAGASTFLNNPSLDPVGDIVPYQLFLTSAYCLHDLSGLSYVTVSFNDLFDFCKKQLGCGCQIIGDTLSIEDLATFFNSATMILDLGGDIEGLEISQLTEGLGANLKLGYAKADINSDFGIDAFNTGLYFDTPLSNIPQIMDYEETAILTEMYAAEKIIVQKVSQPVGAAFDPANPSGDNQSVIFYCESATVDVPTSEATFYDPINNFVAPYPAFPIKVFADAQSADPSAATAPYIHGLYYPDTAINVPLSPCRALQRSTGRLLHSMLDVLDEEYLSYRNFGIMQYNNQVLDTTGIESNLNIGGGSGAVITEFKDIKIGDLPPQLFKPIVFKFKSKYPVNMYQILNTTPNGYVRFLWTNKAGVKKEYKMFLSKATQAAGTNAATEFEGWATPDMVI